MPRREATWLRDMLDAARLAHSVVAKQSYEAFAGDFTINNAVVFQLLIVGEAAKQVSETTCQKYPQVNWRQWKRTRDNIVHAYFNIELNAVWDTATNQLPSLIEQLDIIVEEEYGPKN